MKISTIIQEQARGYAIGFSIDGEHYAFLTQKKVRDFEKKFNLKKEELAQKLAEYVINVRYSDTGGYVRAYVSFNFATQEEKEEIEEKIEEKKEEQETKIKNILEGEITLRITKLHKQIFKNGEEIKNGVAITTVFEKWKKENNITSPSEFNIPALLGAFDGEYIFTF